MSMGVLIGEDDSPFIQGQLTDEFDEQTVEDMNRLLKGHREQTPTVTREDVLFVLGTSDIMTVRRRSTGRLVAMAVLIPTRYFGIRQQVTIRDYCVERCPSEDLLRERLEIAIGSWMRHHRWKQGFLTNSNDDERNALIGHGWTTRKTTVLTKDYAS